MGIFVVNVLSYCMMKPDLQHFALHPFSAQPRDFINIEAA